MSIQKGLDKTKESQGVKQQSTQQMDLVKDNAGGEASKKNGTGFGSDGKNSIIGTGDGGIGTGSGGKAQD